MALFKRTHSGDTIILPPRLAWFRGGNYEASNGGYAWRPSVFRMIYRYYHEGWKENGRTLWGFIRLDSQI